MKKLETLLRKSYLLALAYLIIAFLTFNFVLSDSIHVPVVIEWLLRLSLIPAAFIVISWSVLYLPIVFYKKIGRLSLILAAILQLIGYVFGVGWFIWQENRPCNKLPQFETDVSCMVDGVGIFGGVILFPFLLSIVGLVIGAGINIVRKRINR